MKQKYCLSLIIIILYFFSCSSNPPKILNHYWQINLFNDIQNKKTYQKLSLFCILNDDDGLEDIEALYVINDSEELFWEVNSSTWTNTVIQNETWIGTNSIIMNDYSAIPGGNYRLLVQDFSGEIDEKIIYITPSNTNASKKLIPNVIVAANDISISGREKSYTLWLYDDENFINKYVMPKGNLNISSITSQNPKLKNYFNFYVYTFIQKNRHGIITGPYYYSNAE